MKADGDGEMAQQFRTLAALPESQVQLPVPIWWLTTICTSSPRESDTILNHKEDNQSHVLRK